MTKTDLMIMIDAGLTAKYGVMLPPTTIKGNWEQIDMKDGDTKLSIYVHEKRHYPNEDQNRVNQKILVDAIIGVSQVLDKWWDEYGTSLTACEISDDLRVAVNELQEAIEICDNATKKAPISVCEDDACKL